MPYHNSHRHLMDTVVRPHWKAVLGFLTPTATFLTYAVTDASKAGEHITQGEWVTAICAAFLTGGTVYFKGNKDPAGTRQDESVQPPEDGEHADDDGDWV